MKLGGFWSYVHADDDADFGRVADLAMDLVAQYEMITGESIELFLDRDSLEWGNEWKGKVDGSLSSVAFFIPVFTPRYFQSAECRRELRTFAQRAQALGVSELVLPLKYVDFPALHEVEPADELVTLVKAFQWEDWTDVRFAKRTSAAYRQRVAGLAERLVRANAEAAQSLAAKVSSSNAAPDDTEGGDDPGPPGVVDLIADAETAMPNWSQTVERLGAIIVNMGERMQAAQGDIEAAENRGKGFAGRLTVLRRLAQELSAPGDEVLRLSSDFVQELNAVDGGVRAIAKISRAALADPEQAQDVRDFFGSVRDLSVAVHDGLGSIEEMLQKMEPIEGMSRDLRPVLKKYRQGLTDMFESRSITDEWLHLIDEVENAAP